VIAGTLVGLSTITLVAVGALMDGVLGSFVAGWGVIVGLVGVDVMTAHRELGAHELPAAMLRRRRYAKQRRDSRRAAAVCIDQPDRGPKHGPVTTGGRCAACWEKSR